ncbi:MAG TPA: hypothetical protein VL361_14240 [Candidatus Limnocylindrales bacterium]|nr:hypothetical protein [Candidatus Limnocylindrales bacterium]
MNEIKSNRLIALGTACLCVINAIGAQDIPEFEVDGVMTVEQPQFAFPPGGGPARFQVSVRGCQWAVRHIRETIIRGTTERNAGLLVTETSDNGTNIHLVQHLEEKTSDSLSYDSTRALSNSSWAQIHPSGFPRWIVEPEMVCLFYAYASSCYFDSVTNNLLDPVSFSPMDLRWAKARQRAVFRRHSGSAGLPVQICFLDDSGPGTNATLISSSFTNISGFQIPLRVVYTRYDAGGEPRIIYEFQGTGVKANRATVSFNPELPAGTWVSDYRFYQGELNGGVIQLGNMDHWPTETEVKLRPEYNRRNVILPPLEPDSLQKLRPYYDSLQRGLDRGSVTK